MMRADALNLHIFLVIMYITGTQYILISHACNLDESESKDILAEENLPQVCSTDKVGSESVMVDESSM